MDSNKPNSALRTRMILEQIGKSPETHHFIVDGQVFSDLLLFSDDFIPVDKYLRARLDGELGRFQGFPVVVKSDASDFVIVETHESDLLPVTQTTQMPVYPQWEYRIETINYNGDYRVAPNRFDPEANNGEGGLVGAEWRPINDLGAEGWELVAWSPDHSAIFKRPVLAPVVIGPINVSAEDRESLEEALRQQHAWFERQYR